MSCIILTRFLEEIKLMQPDATMCSSNLKLMVTIRLEH